MLQLTPEEQAWLDAYREAQDKKHPGAVEESDHLWLEGEAKLVLIVSISTCF